MVVIEIGPDGPRQCRACQAAASVIGQPSSVLADEIERQWLEEQRRNSCGIETIYMIFTWTDVQVGCLWTANARGFGNDERVLRLRRATLDPFA